MIESEEGQSNFVSTKQLLLRDEVVDVVVHSTPVRSRFQRACMIFGMSKTYLPYTALTFTNRGIYLETHEANGVKRVVSVFGCNFLCFALLFPV